MRERERERDAEGRGHVAPPCFVCTLKNARDLQSAAHTRDLLADGVGGALSFLKQELVPSRAQLPSAEGRLRDACLEVGWGWGGNIYKYIYMYLVPSRCLRKQKVWWMTRPLEPGGGEEGKV